MTVSLRSNTLTQEKPLALRFGQGAGLQGALRQALISPTGKTALDAAVKPKPDFMARLLRGVTGVTEFTEANPANELLFNEILGFTFPRTTWEWILRGWAAARENLIREQYTFLTQTYLSSVLAGGLSNGVYNRNLMGLNPQGLHWGVIHANTLTHLGNEFHTVLQTAKTPLEARRAFLERIFNAAEPSDPYLMREGILPNLETPELQHAADHLKQDAETLRKRRSELAKHFELADHGLTPLDAHVRQLHPDLPVHSEAYGQARLKLSNQHFKTWQPQNAVKNFIKSKLYFIKSKPWLSTQPAKTWKLGISTQPPSTWNPWLQQVDKAALELGLTDRLNLGPLKQIGRQQLLRDIRTFMEQYVDRALSQLDPQGVISDKISLTPDLRDQITHTLHGSQADRALLLKRWDFQNLTPKLTDGLIPYALRSKPLMTWLPFIAAISVGVVGGFVNNALTRKLSGGSNASPLEHFRVEQGQSTTRPANALKKPPLTQANRLASPRRPLPVGAMNAPLSPSLSPSLSSSINPWVLPSGMMPGTFSSTMAPISPMSPAFGRPLFSPLNPQVLPFLPQMSGFSQPPAFQTSAPYALAFPQPVVLS